MTDKVSQHQQASRAPDSHQVKPAATKGDHICFMTTHPATARSFLVGQIRLLSSRGFRVSLVTSPGADLDWVDDSAVVSTYGVEMAREVAPLKDLVSLVRLVRLFRRLRPHLLCVGTPKASLLGMLAGVLTGIPLRVYTVRGLRLQTTRGLKRLLLWTTEWLTSTLATHAASVSDSLRSELARLRIRPKATVRVLGSGSSNGVCLDRFSAEGNRDVVAKLREELRLSSACEVVGMVGRIVRDKGVQQTFEAFERISEIRPRVNLLLVGAFEEGDPIDPGLKRRLISNPRILLTGAVFDAAPYYQLMDVVAFPSYREGFPNVPLEAAAASLPVVSSSATGCVDAVVDGVTGTLVPVADSAALEKALLRYLDDDNLRKQHGRAAKERVEQFFDEKLVWNNWVDYYLEILSGSSSRDS